MIKVKRNYYLRLAVYYILFGILIGGFFYLLNHATHHKDYAIYYYMGAFFLFILGCVLGLICKAEIYCFPQECAAEKEILIEAKTQEIINEGIKKGIVISTEEIIECLSKQDEEKDFYSTKEDLALVEKSKQDFRDKHGSTIPIATVYEIAKQYRKLYTDKYDRIIAIINTKAYGYYEGRRAYKQARERERGLWK